MEKELYSVREVANKIGIDPATVQRKIRAGLIKASKPLNGHWRVSKAELDRIMSLEAKCVRN